MTKNKNILIGGLIAVVLVMTIAYAAFASQLNITGTGNITSEWNIHFDTTKTDDIEGVVVATKATGATTSPTGTLTYTGDLSVTLTPTLVNPGDTVEFNLTVVNDGNIDAMLETINMPASTNPAIKFTRSGMEEGTKLPANSSKTFTITVEYDSTITGQPESTTADISATLTFVQDDGSTPEITQTVYRYTTDTLNIGDSIDGIETTTDYTTLNKNVFLKHITNGDNNIVSTELCFVKNVLNCLMIPDDFDVTTKPIDENFGPYQVMKSQFEESQCYATSGTTCDGSSCAECVGDNYRIGIHDVYDWNAMYDSSRCYLSKTYSYCTA